jgi:hypothetical protein
MAADRQVVVCEPLCFARCKFGKVPEKQLREVLVDFYDVNQLSLAKSRLCDDIDLLKLDKWPRPSRRRDSDNRSKMEVEDIVCLLTFLDEKLILDNLPIYVAEDVDRLPSTKWMDGDFLVLIEKLNKLEETNTCLSQQLQQLLSGITENRSTMSTINDNVDVCNTQIVDSVKAVRSLECKVENQAINIDTLVTSVKDIRVYAAHTNAVVHQYKDHVAINRPGCTSSDLSNSNTTAGCVDHTSAQLLSGNSAHFLPARSAMDWAADDVQTCDNQASTVQPVYANVLGLGGSTTGYDSADDGGPFTLVSNRKRLRQNSPEYSYSNRSGLPATMNFRQAVTRPESTRTRVMKVVGKLQSTCRIKASNSIISKAVFCVSNVSTDYSSEDIQSFLQDNNVHVINVFDARTKFEDSKSFRVCIASKDISDFLNPDIWPQNVIIREWFFKPKPKQ